jgi:hypothetical protein
VGQWSPSRRATWLLAASAGLPVAVEDGGTQGCL